jgi:hypothetical protein
MFTMTYPDSESGVGHTVYMERVAAPEHGKSGALMIIDTWNSSPDVQLLGLAHAWDLPIIVPNVTKQYTDECSLLALGHTALRAQGHTVVDLLRIRWNLEQLHGWLLRLLNFVLKECDAPGTGTFPEMRLGTYTTEHVDGRGRIMKAYAGAMHADWTLYRRGLPLRVPPRANPRSSRRRWCGPMSR